jgi:hypothetical protein
MNDKDREALNIFWNKWRENWLKMDHRQIPENPTLVVFETWQAACRYKQKEIDELKEKLEASDAVIDCFYEATKKVGW